MKKKLKCPFCGSTRFLKTINQEIEMLDDGETIEDVIINSAWDLDATYTCIKCDRDLTDIELERAE